MNTITAMRTLSGPVQSAVLLCALAGRVRANEVEWANNGADFNTRTNWVGGFAPGTSNVAVFPAEGGPELVLAKVSGIWPGEPAFDCIIDFYDRDGLAIIQHT
ncbi:MAG: hypothetical protein JXB13_13685 [Phycisphaerae bacterium]|nr:hypothetical protein [Phycisphaerae bacterium]